jgi:hypothetical protein
MLPTRIKFSIAIGAEGTAVGMETGYWLNDREVGVRVPIGSRIFSSPHRPDYPATYTKGTGEYFSGYKAAGE